MEDFGADWERSGRVEKPECFAKMGYGNIDGLQSLGQSKMD
jgi:hypothetical protein